MDFVKRKILHLPPQLQLMNTQELANMCLQLMKDPNVVRHDGFNLTI
jgi:hypothetical protein